MYGNGLYVWIFPLDKANPISCRYRVHIVKFNFSLYEYSVFLRVWDMYNLTVLLASLYYLVHVSYDIITYKQYLFGRCFYEFY